MYFKSLFVLNWALLRRNPSCWWVGMRSWLFKANGKAQPSRMSWHSELLSCVIAPHAFV